MTRACHFVALAISLAWTEDRRPRDEELLRFRAEAAALMGIDPAAPVPKAEGEPTALPK